MTPDETFDEIIEQEYTPAQARRVDRRARYAWLVWPAAALAVLALVVALLVLGGQALG